MALNTQQVPRRKIYVVPANGTYVTISATGICRYMLFQECPPGTYSGTFTAQGLIYQRGDESYVNNYAVPALSPAPTFDVGERDAKRYREIGIPSGMTDPAGQSIAQSEQSTVKVTSATSTATNILVLEYN